ncbi:hypothetical protein [Streptosporangium roseum]|uniref:Uncharacterized protein n=1 Tax=Streptosporangium roseum (strain ATCC 12428 / DSM 43021 / JCM 3005 / KCTC 9067 / NCIMB 10171 / NRRL 2505 / NI 9100) TaxID=479432 RepID=D2ASU9_STRRD|nr:hypothetical protein [Streptosporangium roseum]ACZ90426.1 hypothetical protein Sros_7757 [Streptosporangium roseum DSM 43021]
MTDHEIGFEWALEGKRPGAHDDYELLDWSDDRLGPEVFEEIRSRYATGLSADLPQVTIAVAATREHEQVSRHIVLAAQEWSGHRDATNRKIVHTRWFYVPYQELAAHQVSYEALYRALAGLPVTPSPPLVVGVPEFDPTALVPGPDARCAAALLLTGRPVCVVGADRVPMIERLRFLDTVAALLPYGMRTRLTAATWTSSTARHKIRLSFARHAPENAYEVRWGHGTEITWRDGRANVCLGLLARPDVRLADMLQGLAGLTDPLSFGPEDLPDAARLLENAGSGLLPPGAKGVWWKAKHPSSEDPRTGGPGADTGVAAGHRKALPGPGAPGSEDRDPVPGGGGVPEAGAVPPAAATVPYRPTAAAGPAPGAVPPSMQAALGGLEQADRERRPRPGWGLRGKVTMVAAFTTLAITSIGTGVVAMLLAPGGDPPAAGDAAGTEPGTVVVQAPSGQEDAFARNLVAKAVQRTGYRFEIRLSDAPAETAPVAEPAVVLVEIPPADPALSGPLPTRPVNPLAAQGFSEVATIPVPDRDVLVYDAGLIKPEKLTAAFAHQDEEIRISVPDTSQEGPSRKRPEQILRQRHPWLHLETVPALDPLRALRDKAVQAAIVPRETARDSGYPRSEALAGLPGRSLLILCNQAGGRALRDALDTVARSIDPGRLASEDFDSPVTAAARLVESALPSPSGAVPRAGDLESDWRQDPFWPALSLIAVGGAAGFLALLLAIRLPTRIEPHPHPHPPHPPSAPASPGS